MGVGWALDTKPTLTNDLPPRPALSGRGTIIRNDDDAVNLYRRDIPASSSSLNGPTHSNQVVTSRDPRLAHNQIGSREQTRGGNINIALSGSGSQALPQPQFSQSEMFRNSLKLKRDSKRVHKHALEKHNLTADLIHTAKGMTDYRSSSCNGRHQQPEKSSRSLASALSSSSSHNVDKGKQPMILDIISNAKRIDEPKADGFVPVNNPYNQQLQNSQATLRTNSTATVSHASQEEDARQEEDPIDISDKWTLFQSKKGLSKGPLVNRAAYEKAVETIKTGIIDWNNPTITHIDLRYDLEEFPPPESTKRPLAATSANVEPMNESIEVSPPEPTKKPPTVIDVSRSPNNEPISRKKLKVDNGLQLPVQPSLIQVANQVSNMQIDRPAPPRPAPPIAPDAKLSTAFMLANTDPTLSVQESTLRNTIRLIYLILDSRYVFMPISRFYELYDRGRSNISPTLTLEEVRAAYSTDLKDHVVVTSYPPNPIAKFIRLKNRDRPERRLHPLDVQESRRQFVVEANECIFPHTTINVNCLVYLMESLRPNPLSVEEVERRLETNDLYEFLYNSSRNWSRHEFDRGNRLLIVFNGQR